MRHFHLPVVALALAISGLTAGCQSTAGSRIHLALTYSRGDSGQQYTIMADIAGRKAGITYRFSASDGSFNPEEDESGSTVYTPAPGAQSARITVEALRGQQIVDRTSIDLPISSEPDSGAATPNSADGPRPPTAPPTLGSLSIEITRKPRYDPIGGPDTREDIAGVVRGLADPSAYRVALYAHTDLWYVQPLLGSTTEIGRDGSWSTWTHTGKEYVALVVRNGYQPSPQLGQPPDVEGEVLATLRFDGQGKK